MSEVNSKLQGRGRKNVYGQTCFGATSGRNPRSQIEPFCRDFTSTKVALLTYKTCTRSDLASENFVLK